jgi:hypothetical protein
MGIEATVTKADPDTDSDPDPDFRKELRDSVRSGLQLSAG